MGEIWFRLIFVEKENKKLTANGQWLKAKRKTNNKI
jgi:hypothetical protein